MEKDFYQNEPSEPQVENISLRQLNSERLKFLNGRFAEEAATALAEPGRSAGSAPNPFDNFQASVPDEPKFASGALQKMTRKFSTSWLNMQQYLGDRRQNRDWDSKFK